MKFTEYFDILQARNIKKGHIYVILQKSKIPYPTLNSMHNFIFSGKKSLTICVTLAK